MNYGMRNGEMINEDTGERLTETELKQFKKDYMNDKIQEEIMQSEIAGL